VIPNDNSDDIGFSLRNVSGLPYGLKEEIKKYDDNVAKDID